MADFLPSPEEQEDSRSGFEPELGGFLRDAPERSGLEPELGGVMRQKGVYVDGSHVLAVSIALMLPVTRFILNQIMGDRE